MNLQLFIGLPLFIFIGIGSTNAQSPAATQEATPPASSPAAPNTAMTGTKKETFKQSGISVSTSSPILYLRDGDVGRSSALSTLVVVPAEGANDLLRLQTNAITTLSNRLKVIEDRLEKLEQKK